MTPEYAVKCGADGYAKDASEIVRVAKKLIGVDIDTEVPSPLSVAVKAIEDMAKKAPGVY